MQCAAPTDDSPLSAIRIAATSFAPVAAPMRGRVSNNDSCFSPCARPKVHATQSIPGRSPASRLCRTSCVGALRSLLTIIFPPEVGSRLPRAGPVPLLQPPGLPSFYRIYFPTIVVFQLDSGGEHVVRPHTVAPGGSGQPAICEEFDSPSLRLCPLLGLVARTRELQSSPTLETCDCRAFR